MSDGSKIEWTDATWNPVRGCSRVSRGCGGPGKEGGCYAEQIAARFSAPSQPVARQRRRWSCRVGKKLAGRLLDGREWNEFPESGCSR